MRATHLLVPILAAVRVQGGGSQRSPPPAGGLRSAEADFPAACAPRTIHGDAVRGRRGRNVECETLGQSP